MCEYRSVRYTVREAHDEFTWSVYNDDQYEVCLAPRSVQQVILCKI